MQSTVHRALLTVTLAAICAIADAGTPDESARYTVRFADLDLTRSADVVVLYQRIRAAAREVCQALREHDLTLLAASRSCAVNAIERAVGDVNSPTLSRYHQMKTEALIITAHR